MKFTTLFENTSCSEELAHGHGLSIYIETAKHKILFDMGPDDGFLKNAKKLGVDLEAVDTAVLSHGHYDHGGGLETFCWQNPKAKIYIHQAAFGDYYSNHPEQGLEYIGIDQSLDLYRFTLTGNETVIDEELMLFGDVADPIGALSASANLCQKTWDGVRQDVFYHEHNLLIREGDKAVLVAGCAHRGIVNIVNKAEKLLGRRPDAVISGFHLFRLTAGDPKADELIHDTAEALTAGDTVYYTGHCTGDYAFECLKEILGDRLHRISGGVSFEI
ncbi:MAG: MBL fold metallo-hydrolase [Oscillibacter sp.]|nr:MBL fold metallo-hydrolase [Oscillibacter sp.]MBQ2996309.1 MBL fold metallo-hydrolase [Oscillibacter sp.]